MTLLLDTNILLVIVLRRSPYHWVYQSLRQGDFSLVVSTDILEEYEEKLQEFYGSIFAEAVMAELLNMPNIIHVSPSFFWIMISRDPDDNKFVDAYVAGNAELLVSNDGHFRDIFSGDFPIINWALFADFVSWLEGKNLVLQTKTKR